MRIEILNHQEIEYITKTYSLQDIEESSAEEVTNYLWYSYGSYLTLGEAQERVKEIIEQQKEYDQQHRVNLLEIHTCAATAEDSEVQFNKLYESLINWLNTSNYNFTTENIEFDYEYDDTEEPDKHVCKAVFKLTEK